MTSITRHQVNKMTAKVHKGKERKVKERMISNNTLITSVKKMMNVVDDDLNLKRNGRVYKALCQFHNERTPSFTVYPANQSFHCFGCERSGTVIDYVMYRDNIKEPYVAVEQLAEENNIIIPGF